jgi:membrane protein implicated in regulation of membrane protease activity
MSFEKQWEMWVLQMQIRSLVFLAITLVITVAIWYFVTRKATKDGIIDAYEELGLRKTWNRAVQEAEIKATMPDMRADR